MIPYYYVIWLSLILFSIALYAIITHRDGITFLVSAEIILNASLINLVSASSYFDSLKGSSYALLVLVIAVIETVVVIGMLLVLSKKTGSVSFSNLRRTKG